MGKKKEGRRVGIESRHAVTQEVAIAVAVGLARKGFKVEAELVVDGVMRKGSVSFDAKSGRSRFIFASDTPGTVTIDDLRKSAPTESA